MASNAVEIVGDSGTLRIVATPLAANTIEFLSGTFRSTPEERRVVTVFFIVDATKTFELRFEFTDSQFIETNIFGRRIYDSDRV